ncbi:MULTISPECIES: phage antirepressor KilAC domain-containing protein [unclassified Pseudomonas]|uniref:phage antirepressor KilAC domain-containing protein n=1 Tax=unclassified Pseudomonas TaxID=196821 RepID=UPI002361498C|nr:MULTISPECIES: phage antirepressor KilAC domain-containing protein [unclassified Pseudomonas]
MNDLTLTGNTLTMSSREIAELTGRRHDNVMRVCRDLKASGVTPQIEEYPFDHLGNTYFEFRLGKRDSLVLVARLSPEFTAKVVDRWLALEQQAQTGLPQTFAEALRLAADQAERIEQQQAQIAAAAPKVAFVEQYVEGTGLKGFRQVCKLLGANENEFRLFLADAHVWYRLGGEWVPYAEHITAGRFHVKTGQAGNGHNFNAAKFTPKGIEWIAGKWAAYKLQGAA